MIGGLRPAVRKWLLLKLNTGQYCNQKCTFCHAVEKDVQIKTPLAVMRVKQALSGRFTGIYFSGGEPTIRKDLRALMAQASKQGMESGLITNGRLLSYRKFAAELVRLGLREAHVSLHGGTPAVHDHMVAVDGGFEQTVAGIHNLLELGVCVNTNFVACRENYRDLPAYLELLGPLPLERIRISLAFPRGRAREDLEQLPELEIAADWVQELAMRHQDQANLHFDGFPACLMPAGSPSVELLECDITAMQEAWEDDWYPTDQGSARHAPECRDCARVLLCAGLHDAYRTQCGGSPVKPIRAQVANAFDFRITETVAPATEGCPIPADVRDRLHPLRDVVVETDQGLSVAHTDTGDFSLLELRRIVHEDGQVYLQVGEQAFIDDFSRELRLLVPSDRCGDCERGLSCPGLWRAEPVDRLGDAVNRLRDRLVRLEGDVLDVGRGSGRFDDVFAAANVTYHGVDPDPVLIARAQAARPDWRLEVGGAESVELAANGYDAILLLFSHNHLASTEVAYGRLVRALRPGGTLIVCENIPFGIVRPGHLVDTVRADQASHPSEHVRNDFSGWVRPEIERLGLELVEERPAVFGGVNEWYLELRKPLRSGEPSMVGERPQP